MLTKVVVKLPTSDQGPPSPSLTARARPHVQRVVLQHVVGQLIAGRASALGNPLAVDGGARVGVGKDFELDVKKSTARRRRPVGS